MPSKRRPANRTPRHKPERIENVDLIVQALACAIHAPRGLTGSQARRISYVPSGPPVRLSGDLQVVHLTQEHFGVPVLDAGRSVRFDSVGRFLEVTGRPTVVPLPLPEARCDPEVAAQAASRRIREMLPGHVRELSIGRASTMASFNRAARPTVLRMDPLEHAVTAELRIMGAADDAKLAWEVRFRLPDSGGVMIAMVDASRKRNPPVLDVQRLSAHAGTWGKVHEFSPGEQDGQRVRRDFPPSDVFPTGLTRQPPGGPWTSGDTSGNNAICLDGSGNTFRGAKSPSELAFDPTGASDIRLVNAFYLVNFAHDFFWLLGFDEELGNFQEQNQSGRGSSGDAVEVTVLDRELDGNAFFVSACDGFTPELHLGRISDRHTALDADIVIHEYVHGVTNRVIGGPRVDRPLRHPQSRALGEGFSDYFALSIQNYYRRRQNRPLRNVFGQWVSGNKPGGLRPQAYGPGFSGTLGLLGTPGFKEDHEAGAIWCQALLRLNQVLAAGGDAARGDELGWQVVFNALNLLHPGPAGPSFLHARTAVIDALTRIDASRLTADRETLLQGVRQMFGSMGMGAQASSPDLGFSGIHEDMGDA